MMCSLQQLVHVARICVVVTIDKENSDIGQIFLMRVFSMNFTRTSHRAEGYLLNMNGKCRTNVGCHCFLLTNETKSTSPRFYHRFRISRFLGFFFEDLQFFIFIFLECVRDKVVNFFFLLLPSSVNGLLYCYLIIQIFSLL